MKNLLWLRGAILLVISGLVGCSTVPRHFADAERELNTNGSITRAFHSVLYYPDQIALNTDGYIVGLEKTEKATISRSGDVRVKAMPEVGFATVADSAAKLDDHKIFYVSHIIQRTANGNCPLYNLYRDISPERTQFFDSACTGAESGGKRTGTTGKPASGAYSNSWGALTALRRSITASLTGTQNRPAPYTHVVVMTMGWNTPQDEAVRNFNSIIRNLSTAMNAQARAQNAPDTFRPLIVGVTWPSQWSSAWFDPVLKLFSFSSKAEDADQIGLSWLGVLMHDTIPGAIADVRDGKGIQIPVVAIGHSFGSRALSTAVCAGPVIYADDAAQRAVKTDVLINYQGAFQSKRLFETVSEHGMHYPARCPNAKRLVLTASKWDEAVTRPIWGIYAGSMKSYAIECGLSGDPIDCRIADASGNLAASGRPARQIVYVNADALIAENAHDTGGGAHSDIFRPEHGVLLRQLLELPTP